jgi:RNA polymerase sigma-70 factor (sigma-E family)
MSSDMAGGDSAKESLLSELYARHASEGIRLAYLLTGDPVLAEDLVQEAFARIAGRLGHLRHREAFAPYLRRTIINLSRSHFRRKRVERSYVDRLARSPERTPNPNDELDERMHTALLRVPERQRTALILRFYEDLSDVQTAEEMRCSAGTVRSLVSRGMKSLRTELEGVPR